MHIIFKLIFTTWVILQLSGCSSLLFHPMSVHVRTPENIGLKYRDIWLQTADNKKVHGWFLPAQIPLRGSVYFLHGNAQNISTHIENVYWLPEQGYQVFLLDYRGYGLSQGDPNIPDVFQDIDAGFTWLLEQAQDQPVYILGQSLGASLAIFYSANNALARQHLAGVISDAAFTDYAEISRHVAGNFWLTWLIQYPVAWLMSKPYNPIDVIADLAPVPVLIMHSQKDTIIPYTQGKQLYAAAKSPKYFLEVPGLHTQTFAFLKQRYLLLEFLNQPGNFRYASLHGQQQMALH